MKEQPSTTSNPGHSADGTKIPSTDSDSNREMVLAIGTFGMLLPHKDDAAEAVTRVHGYHSLVFFVLSLALYGLFSLLRGMFGSILPVLPLAWVAGFAFLLWSAFKGHPKMFPVLKGIAERQAGASARASSGSAE